MSESLILLGERERAALLPFLRSLVGGDAEDVAQEALLRAYAARGRFGAGRSVLAWLRAIAANVAFDFLRRRRRVRFVPLESARSEPAAGDATAAEARAAREERLLAALRAALDDLPEMERRAFRLFYEDDRSVGGVARALGAPPGTVKSWLHRARERLRVRLESLATEEA